MFMEGCREGETERMNRRKERRNKGGRGRKEAKEEENGEEDRLTFAKTIIILLVSTKKEL